jgi:alpha-mannosidase
VKYVFSNDGTLIEAWDKQCRRPIVAEASEGNVFSLYNDRPHNYDAWNLDVRYNRMKIAQARAAGQASGYRGGVRSGLKFALKIEDSDIEQHIVLEAGTKRLDFYTTVHWREKHHMLRVAFPMAIDDGRARYDIQYGYLERPVHQNTTWDEAKFEVLAQRYVDLSRSDYGVALLNDCKYGHRVFGNVIDLDLLRSPTYPDPDADQGTHTFRYSLLPHGGDFLGAGVIEQADQINRGVSLFEGCEHSDRVLPVRVEGAGLSLEVLKRAEKESCLIIRVLERLGCYCTGTIHLSDKHAKLVATNLIEWDQGETVSNGKASITIELKPFEIVTFKLYTDRFPGNV